MWRTRSAILLRPRLNVSDADPHNTDHWMAIFPVRPTDHWMANATTAQFTFKTPSIPRKYYRKPSSDRSFQTDHWNRSLDRAVQ